VQRAGVQLPNLKTEVPTAAVLHRQAEGAAAGTGKEAEDEAAVQVQAAEEAVINIVTSMVRG
jgi:hypothetical protein